jgi:hypothetical protein
MPVLRVNSGTAKQKDQRRSLGRVLHLSEFERAELKFFSDVRRRRRHDERKCRVWKLLPDSKIFRRDSEPPKSEHISTRFSHSSDLCPGDLVDGQSFPPSDLARHSSLFSFRRPQCFSFDESYSGIGLAPCSASIIPT